MHEPSAGAESVRGGSASARAPAEVARQGDVIAYFEVAGPDYAAWSRRFNMHFGFWVRGLNPLRREPMLERMNLETLERLRVPVDRAVSLTDMGCGLGATARTIAERRPQARITGFTIVPWQVESGNGMCAEQGLGSRVVLALSDYTHTPCGSGSQDGAFAIESACYASGPDKGDLLAEMARIVKPGGRVVISDGFRKDARPLGFLLGRIYRIACRSGVIREMASLEELTHALRANGFVDVRAEEVSWRVAPSFAHVPFLCVAFALRRWLKGDFLWPKERWQNLAGPLFGSLLGLHRRRFGYYFVSATRDAEPRGGAGQDAAELARAPGRGGRGLP